MNKFPIINPRRNNTIFSFSCLILTFSWWRRLAGVCGRGRVCSRASAVSRQPRDRGDRLPTLSPGPLFWPTHADHKLRDFSDHSCPLVHRNDNVCQSKSRVLDEWRPFAPHLDFCQRFPDSAVQYLDNCPSSLRSVRCARLLHCTETKIIIVLFSVQEGRDLSMSVHCSALSVEDIR